MKHTELGIENEQWLAHGVEDVQQESLRSGYRAMIPVG